MILDNARFCLNCRNVHDESLCPSCGSHHWHLMVHWLDRESVSRPMLFGMHLKEAYEIFRDWWREKRATT